MKIIIISKETIKPTVWDGGETFEYFIYPENSSYANRDFLYRISAATIDKIPSEFTKFDNYQRFLVMLSNTLFINKNGNKESYSVNDVFKFESNNQITSYTKGKDFNLMIRNDVKKADVFLANDTVELSESVVFLFAKTTTILTINKTEFFLQPYDLLFIENKNLDKITVETNQLVIVGYLTEKNK